MSILNQIPKPTINLDFVQMQENRNTLSALRSVVSQIPGSAVDFSALRASKKYTQNRLGLITEAPLNVPALSFDNGVAKGFLAEGGATNIAQKSEELDNADFWLLTRTTIETSAVVNPRGGAGSFSLAEDVESGVHTLSILVGKRPIVTSGLPYTGSFYFKKNSAVDIIQLRYPATFNANEGFANFNIATGVVTRQVNGTGAISDEGNGWYRVSFTNTANANVASTMILTFVNNDPNASLAPSYAGSTANTVLVQFAQFEQGSVATSYIPTTTETVARSADNFRITGASGAIGTSPVLVANWATQASPNVINKGLINPNGDNYLNGVVDNSFTLPFTASSGTYEALNGFFHRKHQIYLLSSAFTPTLSQLLTRP